MNTYESVTARIIKALEDGSANPAAWKKTWKALSNANRSAANRPYRGINQLLLAISCDINGYTEPVWATYKQWQTFGAQVKKGEKGTSVVLWKTFEPKNQDPDAKKKKALVARDFTVFNRAQVEGDDIKCPGLKPIEPIQTGDRMHAIDLKIEATGAVIRNGGDRAFYSPASDYIALPLFESFDTPESYYSVIAHELAHWSGAESRLNRDLSGRFGDSSYAAEELVAELSAAFSMALLGINSEPREDHGHYIANWLQILKEDSRAIFTASTKAQQATDYLFGEPKEEEE
jgi:antirestriction protein ArdC